MKEADKSADGSLRRKTEGARHEALFTSLLQSSESVVFPFT